MLEIEYKCDDCKEWLEPTDLCYCIDCMNKLINKLKEEEKKILELEQKLKEADI